jgi:hypothetical protein
MTELLTLRCWIVDDDLARTFKVKVPKSEDVYALKKAIREEQRPDLDNWPANKLDVWAVAIPLTNKEEVVKKAIELVEQKSRQEGWRLLDDINEFKSPDPRHLHVVVKKPVGA